ncbi:MAG TPA: TonB family protein, partial [Polyangia bacterium]|nr:TonB family protein [Polyangia bacterium]
MTLRLRLALRIPLAVGLTVAALAQAPVAHGQDAPLAPIPPPPPANMNTLTPPRLVTFVDANYPEAARTAHLQANVELELMIDVAGKVTEARVVAPVGNGFEAAAIEAARRFVFEPAKRGDHAIPARIKY